MPLAGVLVIAVIALIFSVIAIVVHWREHTATFDSQDRTRVGFHPSRRHF